MSLVSAEHVIIECQCFSMDHTARISYWPAKFAGEYDEVYLTTHMLNSRPWWRRVVEAFRHIFKLESRHGNWDEMIVSPESAEKLIPVLQLFVNRRRALAERCKK